MLKQKIILLFTGLFWFYGLAIAQNKPFDKYIYTVYGEAQGLKGTTIYDICQDSLGFIWIGTNEGLSRYDGKNFKNYTTKDGLPATEVFKLFVDAKNRVWIGTLKPLLCYYKDNKFTVVPDKEKVIKKEVMWFAMDDNKDVVMADFNNLFRYKNDSINLVFQSKNVAILFSRQNNLISKNNYCCADYDIYTFFLNKAIIIDDSAYYYFKDGQVMLSSFIFKNDVKFQKFINTTTKTAYLDKVNYAAFNGSKQNGINFKSYKNLTTLEPLNKTQKTDTLFIGKTMNRIFIDKEENYWAGGANTGLCKLVNKNMEQANIKFDEKEIFCLGNNNKNVLAGTEDSKLLFINGNQTNTIDISIKDNYNGNITKRANNNIRKIIAISPTKNLILTNGSIQIIENNNILNQKNLNGVKFGIVYKNEFIIGTKNFIIKYDLNLNIIDTLYFGRVVTGFLKDEKLYFGLPTGLKIMNLNNKEIIFTGLEHLQINDITYYKGKIWLGTDFGVYSFNDNNIEKEETDINKGLKEKNINCLYINNNILFIGTNNGLLFLNNNQITRYTTADGIISNRINAIYIIDSIIYLGTNKGLCFFNPSKISNQSICRLVLETFTMNGINYDNLKNNIFKSNSKDFELQFIAIAPKSDGDVTYYYQLIGLDDSLKTTNEASFNYPKLLSGDYTFKIYAINKFGLKSNEIEIKFTIKKPFYLQGWFLALATLLIIGLFFTFYKIRLFQIAKQTKKQNEIELKLASSEQKALRAQLNPHFVFNSLNAVQQFFITHNLEGGNKYITDFASLLRQTLHNSEEPLIDLNDEIKYLNTYLSLEQLRFKNKFNYTITACEGIKNLEIDFPAMIAQPFLENAIKHGILYKNDGEGLISVHFFTKDGYTTCEIKDNGIGRNASEIINRNSTNSKEYESKGIYITEKRIEILNKLYQRNITIQITDLFNDTGEASGTLVTIKMLADEDLN